MDCVRGCSKRLRIILDVLEIICFHLIHFAIELSGIHIKGGDDGKSVATYRKGELAWLGIVNVFGFIAPIVLLVKVFGFRIPKCLLRGYYSIGSISLLLVSTTVTMYTYFKTPDTSCPETSSTCLGKEENNVGFEIMVLSLTLTNSVFYGYSLVLTWLREDTMTPLEDEELGEGSDTDECENPLFDEMTHEQRDPSIKVTRL